MAFSVIATTDESQLVTGRLLLSVAFQETDTNLQDRLVSGYIDWGDGSPIEVIEQMSITEGDTTSALIFERFLQYGKHVIKVVGTNYRSPDPDTDTVIFFINRIRSSTVQTAKRAVSTGPILPRDVGSPNAQQWELNIGTNLMTIESALKVLLLTQKGERLHDPDFGTNISRFVFQPDDSVLMSLIQQDIAQAVEKYAPYAVIQSLSVNRKLNQRSLAVEVRFITQYAGQQPIQVNLAFER